MKDRHEQVPISALKVGDTVLVDGVLKTVNASAFGRDDLLGLTLWGDSHRSGRKLITKVTFAAEIQRQCNATRVDIQG